MGGGEGEGGGDRMGWRRVKSCKTQVSLVMSITS